MRGAQAWRLTITVVLLVLSLYFLYPTLRLNTMSEDAKIEHPDLVDDLSAKGIKLGLDLQGGMHLLLEPDMVTLLANSATKRDGEFLAVLRENEKLADKQNRDYVELLPSTFRRNGLDLTEYFGNWGGSEAEIIKVMSSEREKAVDGALEVVRSRVDQFGVTEPIIQRAASDRIIVELPGIQDAIRARSLIKETAILEFQLVRSEKEVTNFVEKVDKLLRDDPHLLAIAYGADTEEKGIEKFADSVTDTTAQAPADITTSAPDSVAPQNEPLDVNMDELMGEDSSAVEPEKTVEKDTVAKEEVDTTAIESLKTEDIFGTDSALSPDELPFGEETETVSRPFSSLIETEGGVILVPRTEYDVVRRIIQLPEVVDALPRGSELVWGARDEVVRGISYRFLYLLNDKVELTGDYLDKANFGFGSGTDPRTAGKPVVNLSFDSKGTRIFGQITGANIGRRLAIVLNDRVYTAPAIRTKITSDAQISGIPTLDEAKMISIVLKAGAVPVPLNIKSERTVGPSLGEDSIRMGVTATIIGALLVALFMIIYYKMAGVIADFAVVLNLVALMAGMAAFRATLTLPGIAGIILTIGMAVDANVLIFERIREELRAGKTVRAAIDAGYSRAFRTIVDANVTTLITAAILYNFGTGPVKGFAVTLFMGIVISMITAIVVTRLIFEFITTRQQVESLSI